MILFCICHGGNDFVNCLFGVIVIVAFIEQRIGIVNKQHALLSLDDLLSGAVCCPANISINKILTCCFYRHSFLENASLIENLTDQPRNRGFSNSGISLYNKVGNGIVKCYIIIWGINALVGTNSLFLLLFLRVLF